MRVATGEIVAFSDANALWERQALRELVTVFADDAVAYACGQVAFVSDTGTNQEGSTGATRCGCARWSPTCTR
ncbi:MAG: glycosyltransferase [Solirubrobacterales bacterium]